MGYSVTIRLEGLPQLQSGSFGNWRVRRGHDAKWKDLVGWALTGRRPPKPLERALVVCTRFSAARKPPDDVNLRASFKPLIDALQLGTRPVLVDDDTVHMQDEYHWERCERGEGRVVMVVTDLEGAESDDRSSKVYIGRGGR